MTDDYDRDRARERAIGFVQQVFMIFTVAFVIIPALVLAARFVTGFVEVLW